MSTVAIHQPQYLPYIGFFHKLSHCDVFVLLDDVQFQKGGVQNRNKIKTGQGWQWITVPVFHQSNQLISQVEINREIPWQRKHWTALESSYAPSRFFSLYRDELQGILSKEWNSLSILNRALVEWVMRVLKIETPLELSSELNSGDTVGTDRLVDLCQRVGATRYLSGQGGRNYMNLEAFQRAGIEVAWQDFTPPVYDQVFPRVGFMPNLSVVDAVFSCGPDTAGFLE